MISLCVLSEVILGPAVQFGWLFSDRLARKMTERGSRQTDMRCVLVYTLKVSLRRKEEEWMRREQALLAEAKQRREVCELAVVLVCRVSNHCPE